MTAVTPSTAPRSSANSAGAGRPLRAGLRDAIALTGQRRMGRAILSGDYLEYYQRQYGTKGGSRKAPPAGHPPESEGPECVESFWRAARARGSAS